jgi:hypothetical protein
MKLLIDTDAFCKLAVGGVLEDGLRVLGADLTECGRLPALPYMLRRGRLPRKYGVNICTKLARIANGIPIIPQPGDAWLEILTPLESIDPGEALIFAAAAEHGKSLLSGDKWALRVVKDVPGFPAAMEGRIAVVEAVLIALCDRFGPEDVRRRIQPLLSNDQVVNICFSNSAADPRDGLRSYFESLTAEVAPLVLWNPWSGGGT